VETIQIAINDASYRFALQRMLSENVTCDVVCVEQPDEDAGGVVVVDSDHLDRMALPLHRPEGVVLVAHDGPESLARAWDAGVNSVVFDRDPLNTAVLAVLSARLRMVKAIRGKES
jgi:hypothetical protein